MRNQKEIREKAEYFWMYNKGKVLVIALILVCCSYFGLTVSGKDKTDQNYSILIVNHYMQQEDKAKLKEEASGYMQIPADAVQVDDSVQIDPKNQKVNVASGGLEMVTTQYFARDLDLMIAPREVAEYYCSLSGLEDLSELLDPKVYEKLKPDMLTLKNKEGGEVPCAVSVSASRQKGLLGEEEMYLCVFANSRHDQQNKQMIQGFYAG